MPVAGYSRKPLIKKLGLTEKMSVLLINAPGNYFELLQTDISKQLIDRKTNPDFIHLFVKTIRDLLIEMKFLKKACHENPFLVIWISWYKKSSGIATDITEDVIRNHAIQNNLVDIKVCAVSEDWSGLKFVVPRRKR